MQKQLPEVNSGSVWKEICIFKVVIACVNAQCLHISGWFASGDVKEDWQQTLNNECDFIDMSVSWFFYLLFGVRFNMEGWIT